MAGTSVLQQTNTSYLSSRAATTWKNSSKLMPRSSGGVSFGTPFVQAILLSAWLKAKEEGMQIHRHAFKLGFQNDLYVQNSLINMYGKCGQIEHACAVFEQMDEDTLVTVLSSRIRSGALDSGKCTHGALLKNNSDLNVIVQTSLIDISSKDIYSLMLEEGLDPDDVVYVDVLSVCGHAGLIDEGFECFDGMKSEHGIEPTVQHYGCMVDLMGKAGMISSSSTACLSSPMMWSGEAYVKRLNQVPGFSSVEVGRRIHKFVSQDMSHLRCESIYEVIHQMYWQLKFEGYTPNTSQVLLDADEEENREIERP
ncbi:hypothetical protein GQ457_08G024830 [Hibiscus cannabinus]